MAYTCIYMLEHAIYSSTQQGITNVELHTIQGLKKFSLSTFLSTRMKKHFKNDQRNRDDATKKRTNTSGVGKSNNYYEDIYIPPYNNTH